MLIFFLFQNGLEEVNIQEQNVQKFILNLHESLVKQGRRRFLKNLIISATALGGITILSQRGYIDHHSAYIGGMMSIIQFFHCIIAQSAYNHEILTIIKRKEIKNESLRNDLEILKIRYDKLLRIASKLKNLQSTIV